METSRMKMGAGAVVLVALAMLWVSPALAGGIGGGGSVLGSVGGGGSQFQALSSVKTMLTSNIATIASIGILGIGLAFAFSKSAWTEIVGGIAALVFLLVAVGWAANNTSSFFGNGGLVVGASASGPDLRLLMVATMLVVAAGAAALLAFGAASVRWLGSMRTPQDARVVRWAPRGRGARRVGGTP
jgi:hypothetical protein